MGTYGYTGSEEIGGDADLDAGETLAGEVVVTPECFVAGTRIRVERDGVSLDVAVEDLAVGDIAVTASGTNRPITWLGSRALDCAAFDDQRRVRPIRIAKDAFDESRPARALLVSPGHALCVDILGELMIPAGVLVNGTTIVHDDVDHVTYWHVELDGHDVLLAENMPAESYLEKGNRSFFAEGHAVAEGHAAAEGDVLALDASPDAAVTQADYCRSFYAGGALVEVVRAQLAARVQHLGWALADQGLGDLHLMVDGVRLEPKVRGLAARFSVPADAREMWLVSSTAVPSNIGHGDDRRALGVGVNLLTVDDGFATPRVMTADDPRLCEGFHGVETIGATSLRWTSGRARLPAALWDGIEGDFSLRVDLARAALPRWVAPETAPSP